MDKLHVVPTIFRNLLVKTLIQWRAVVMLLVALPYAYIMIQGAILELGVPVHPVEPFMALMGGSGGSILVLCLLVLLSDAPFFDRNEALVAPRVGRWRWLFVRLGYLLAMCALFLAFLAILCLLLALPAMDWRASSLSEATAMAFMVEAVEVAAMPPWWAFGCTFLLSWLGLAFFALLMFAVNMRYNQGMGLSVSFGLWVFSEFYFFMLSTGGRDAWLSPLYSMLFFNQKTRYGGLAGVPLGFSLIYLGALALVLIAIIMALTPGYPFPFVKGKDSGLNE